MRNFSGEILFGSFLSYASVLNPRDQSRTKGTVIKNSIARLRHNRFAIATFFILVNLVYFALFWRDFVEHFLSPNWLIAPVMAVGSFVAGATFLGGGAVAFPVLTKVMGLDPVTAKTFSLSIQSVGMTSAAIYIAMKVRKLPAGFILLYLLGSSLGMLLSLLFFEGRLQSADLRIGFTLFLLCFLPVYFLTRNSGNLSRETHLEKTPRDVLLTVACGCFGGFISGLIGSGADLIGFSLLALYFRVEIKRATQVSVILMAATSIVGMLLQSLVFQRVGHQVSALWFIAAPIVVFGAPIGVLFCRRVPPKLLMFFISGIVAVEFVSTLLLVPIDSHHMFYYLIAVTLFVSLFFYLNLKRKRLD